MRTRTYYAVKKPGGRRRSFAIQRVTPDGKRETVQSPEVDAVNSLLLAGGLSSEEAGEQVRAVVASLYAERNRRMPKTLTQSDNVRILASYWEAEYTDRDIIEPEKRRRDLEWALLGIGELSVVAAEKRALQEAVDTKWGAVPGRQRRAVSRLNQVLTWLGRGFTLRKKRDTHHEVKYLTLAEFETVVAHIQNEDFACMCRAAFVTGCRAGELFPLERGHFRQNNVWVATQLDRKGTTRETKNRRERRAFVLKERREWLTAWLDLPAKKKKELRKAQHAELLEAACAATWPAVAGEPVGKHVTFHCLRHSYAVYLLQTKGASMQQVANCLGNSVTVCEKYYAGFVLTDPGIDYLERL